MSQITFQPSGTTVSIPAGTSILDAARHAGIEIDAPCGGEGACGQCLVRIMSGKVDFDARGKLDGGLIDKGYVLACRARCTGDAVVEIPQGENSAGRFTDSIALLRMIGDVHLPSADTISPIVREIDLTAALSANTAGLPDYDRFVLAVKKKTGVDSVDCPIGIIRRLTVMLRAADSTIRVIVREHGHGCSVIDIMDGSGSGGYYGVAVDIGTTTIAAALVAFPESRVAALKSDYNGQIACGLDVISRINYARRTGGIDELKQRVLETINACIAGTAESAGIERHSIMAVALSGNTTMTHLVLGLNPEYIRIAPFTPTVLDAPVYSAGTIGLDVHPDAPVVMSPAVGSYVGGDITAGVLCTSFAAGAPELCLFMDIGTNGELVLGNDEFLITCACSAGPAFEGGGIGIGMRACAGAVERVEIDRATGRAQLFTIGNIMPAGICGSGMISLVAGLMRTGWLDRSGKLNRERRSEAVRIDGRRAQYMLAPAGAGGTGRDLVIYETDIENIVRAKAAVYAACALMLGQAGADWGRISRIYIAGGFGRYIDIEDAVTIGLLPDIDRDKFIFIGNASLAGTFLTLVSAKHRGLQMELTRRMTYLELTTDPSYMDQYTAALFLPHTDLGLFPSVKL